MDCLTTVFVEVLILKVLEFVACAMFLLLVGPHLLDEGCIRQVMVTSQIYPWCVQRRWPLNLSYYLCVPRKTQGDCELGLMI